MADEKKQFIPVREQPEGHSSPEIELESPIRTPEPPQPPTTAPQEEVEHDTAAAKSVPPLQKNQILSEEKTQLRKDIERVLEDELGDIYLSLKTKSRQQFKIEGERTAAKIEHLLSSVRVRLIEIIRLIRSWLMLLPGVNSYFLEQEAKIKAEKILALRTSANDFS